MEINETTIVGEIVRSNYKTAQLFEKNKIDYCCGGGISLAEACEQSNTDIKKIVPEIEAIINVSDPDSKYIEQLELDSLCDYIVERHHSYVIDNITFLQQKLQRLCDAHGEHHPELFKVKDLFGESASNLSAHMQKEELILFPYIRNLVKFKKEGSNNSNELGGVLGPITQMDLEHQAEGERFAEMSKLTNDFATPADGCNTYRVTYATIRDFEQDLHRHIHLESNILFKKAIELENELSEK